MVTLTTDIMFFIHVHVLLGVGNFTKVVHVCADCPRSGLRLQKVWETLYSYQHRINSPLYRLFNIHNSLIIIVSFYFPLHLHIFISVLALEFSSSHGPTAYIWALSSSVLRFLHHTQLNTYGRTPLGERSARRRGLYSNGILWLPILWKRRQHGSLPEVITVVCA
jgi:hypothetical protein